MALPGGSQPEQGQGGIRTSQKELGGVLGGCTYCRHGEKQVKGMEERGNMAHLRKGFTEMSLALGFEAQPRVQCFSIGRKQENGEKNWAMTMSRLGSK